MFDTASETSNKHLNLGTGIPGVAQKGGIMDYLKLLHGTYNTIVMALFIRQGWLGFTISEFWGQHMGQHT